jgi:hypothetical protein
MMDAEKLVEIHLELECIGIENIRYLVSIPCAHPDTMPRFYVVKHERYEHYFSHDVPMALQDQLMALPPEVALYDVDEVREIFASDVPCYDVHAGKSYIFPDTLSETDYPDVTKLDESHRPLIDVFNPQMQISDHAVFALITDGKIVSTCESSRENDRAGEAWVQTLLGYRGRGFARQVTAAWGHNLQKQGKIPFYSYQHENVASAAIARSLNLIHYIDDAGYV